jgi:hypothetical protein
MLHYILANKTFKTKKEIVDKIRSIDNSHQDYQPITGEDYDIITDLLDWNSQFKTKSIGMTDIYFAQHKKHNSRCIHIAYGNSSMEIKNRPSDDISWSCCLKYIKQEKQEDQSPLNFRMPYGTHERKMFKTIIENHLGYAKWMLGDTFHDRRLKKKMLEALEEFAKIKSINHTKNIKQMEMFDNNTKTMNKQKPVVIKESYEIKEEHKVRMGIFYNNGRLHSVCLNSKDLIEKWGESQTRSLYKYMRGKRSKHCIKKGYKNKFQVRRLPIGKTFTINETYKISELGFDKKIRKPISKRNTDNVKMQIIDLPNDSIIPNPVTEELVKTNTIKPKLGFLNKIASFFYKKIKLNA